MALDKNILIGVAVGVVAGAIGAKYYSEHKDEITAKIQSLKNGNFNFFNKAEEAESSDLSLEELEAQKERLEDLIADVKSKQEK